LQLEKRKQGPDVWVFRYRDGNTNRKDRIGTVEEFSTKAKASKACEQLRSNLNRETKAPRTVADVISHYTEVELSTKAYATKAVYGSCINIWILPKWGECLLGGVRTVVVESWLKGLPLSNGSRSKIRNVMSAIFSHAIRYEWLDRNPITMVRQSAKRKGTPDVLTTEETRNLLAELTDPCNVMVLLASATGLRVSELLGLKWVDLNFNKGEIHPQRGIVDNHVGNLKTEASGKAVPMIPALANVMLEWRSRCPYNQDEEYVFGSPQMGGKQPYWPDSLLSKTIRPAAQRAGITKRVGWHSFRRTLATWLQANGESVKTMQDMLRHSTSRVTLDVYVQSVSPDRMAAQAEVMRQIQYPSVP
jgi:integrase